MSGNYENISLDKALKDIQKTYDLELAFNSKLFRKTRINIYFNNLPATQAFRKMLAGTGYDVKNIDGVYVFFPKEPDIDIVQNPTRQNFEWGSFVIDRETKEKLPYVIITDMSSGETVQADDQGYFYFYDLRSDTTLLRISHVGYKLTSVRLTPDIVNNNLPISIVKNHNLISRVPVYGERSPMIKVDNDNPITQLDMRSARFLPDLGENDLLRMVQLISGSNGTAERTGELNIRGGESDETTIIYDGFNIYHIDHFYNLFSAVNSNAVKHVQVHKGWFEPKFGGRTAGIIEITGKEGNENYKQTQVDINMTSGSVFFENPLADGKSTVAISARRSFTDVFQSPLYRDLFNNIYNESFRNNGDQINTFEESVEPDFHFSDLNFKYVYRVNKNNKAKVSLYYGRDLLRITYNSELPELNRSSTFTDESEWGNLGFSFQWTSDWSQRFHSKLTIGRSRYQSDLFAVDFREDFLLQTSDTVNVNRKNQLDDLTIGLDNEYYYRSHKFSFGLQMVDNTIAFKEIDVEGNISEQSEEGGLYSAYIQDTWKKNWFKFNGGVRIPYYSVSEKLYIEPRVMLTAEINEKFSVYSSYGLNHQFIRRTNRQNLFLNTPDIWKLTGIDIPELRADQFAFGFSTTKGDRIVKVEYFSRYYTGSIYDVSVTPLYFENDQNSVSVGKKMVNGIDLTWIKSKGNHKGWIGMTYAEISNFNHDLFDYNFPSDHDQTFEFKSAYTYSWKGWSAGAFFIYGSGRPFTPAIGTYTLTLLNGTTREIVTYANLNSDRLPAYHRLDFSLTKHLLFASNNQAEIGISVFNVYNRINVSDRRYYFVEDDTGGQLIEYDVEMLGIIPSLKFKYNLLMIRKLYILLILLSVISCRKQEDPTEGILAVQGVLRTNSVSQRIIVEEINNEFGTNQRVSGALVILSGNNTEVTLQETDPGLYEYVGVDF